MEYFLLMLISTFYLNEDKKLTIVHVIGASLYKRGIREAEIDSMSEILNYFASFDWLVTELLNCNRIWPSRCLSIDGN